MVVERSGGTWPGEVDAAGLRSAWIHRHGYAVALIAVAATLAVLLPMRGWIADAWGWALLLVVAMVAMETGVRPAIVAAAAAFLGGNFFFVRPYYTLMVAEPASLARLVLVTAFALLAGVYGGRLREDQLEARRNEREAWGLTELSARMALETSFEAMVAFSVAELEQLVGVDYALVWLPDATGAFVSADGRELPPGVQLASVMPYVAWVFREAKAVGFERPADPALAVAHGWPVSVRHDAVVPGSFLTDLFLPMQTASGIEGVLQCGVPHGHRVPSLAEQRLIVLMAQMLAGFLENQRLSQAASQAEALHQADRLKGALVASVSHELKTPLAAITAVVTDLLDPAVPWTEARARERLSSVEDDLARLDTSIADLLDTARLEAHTWAPHAEEYGVGEIAGAVVAALRPRERGRVVFAIPDGLPDVRVDFGQVARALRSLLENALHYSSADREVVVGAEAAADAVDVWVADHGRGVPDEEKQLIFEKFFRGGEGARSASSTGLGLSIARDIVLANGGTLWVQDAEGGGARFVMRLPVMGGTCDGS